MSIRTYPILGNSPLLPVLSDQPSEFLAACGRVLTRYTAWRERRRARQSLNAISDAALHDIGIHRCEIDSLVAGNDNTRIRRFRSN
jgi:uncharacterized protein YjiS (DUF1127 family)